MESNYKLSVEFQKRKKIHEKEAVTVESKSVVFQASRNEGD